LHSHTSISEETLHFIHVLGLALPGVKALTKRYESICRKKYGIELDFVRANWRPPLQPKMAYDLEAEQVAKLGLYPLVSITDHDTIDAALLLRTVPSSRHSGVVSTIRADGVSSWHPQPAQRGRNGVDAQVRGIYSES